MKKILILSVAATLVLAVLSCTPATTGTTLSQTAATTATTAATETTTLPTTFLTDEQEVSYEGSYCDELAVDADYVENLLDSMTLAEKAGQMLQAEKNGASAADVRDYNLGSILSGGGSAPANNQASEWYLMYEGFQNAALQSSSGIPIIYGVDAVHGHNNVYGATIFPHNIGLGAANDPELMTRIGTIVAREVRVTGINYTFAPAVSVVQNVGWGRSYESLSESSEVVSNLAGAYVEGLQRYCVASSAKHFLADGGTDGGDDQGNATLTEAQVRAIHLAPYEAAIEAGVYTIMVSYSSINWAKMHASEYWITDVLKDEMGFTGFVISDYNAIHQLSGSYYDQIVASVNAGVDMLMEPFDWKACIQNIVLAVQQGDIAMARIDDAVRRILTIKYKMGLFSDDFYDEATGDYYRLGAGANFYTDENRGVAREAVRKSLVLLKNDNGALPLRDDVDVAVLGEGADNIGLQCGGWTISWQGDDARRLTRGVTILAGIRERIAAGTGTAYTDAEDADVIVAVLSELPYAEFNGDATSPSLTGSTAHPGNADLLQQLLIAKSEGKTIIGLILSGRPLLVTSQLSIFDALVACWLPGSEGGHGIADVLYGDYDFTGRLSVTWPRYSAGFGMNVNATVYDASKVLYPFGYGLDYKED
ncbi:MAG: glycoside hydrolase family 3 protein [Candidatus Izemoplasmatales bacterium]